MAPSAQRDGAFFMPTKLLKIDPEKLTADLRQFLDTVPDADGIRERLHRLRYEQKFLARLLQLAVAAEQAREQGASRD